jgi:hypothetical protein
MQQYNDFFGGLRTLQPSADDSTQSSQSDAPGDDTSPATPGFGASGPAYGDAFFDTTGAGSDDGGYFSLIGNPAHPRLRREWAKKSGQDWPLDPKTGRNQDVAHYRARADGGPDHVDNIRPMPHDEHMAEHMANGDQARWGRRPSIARAFGGTVARSIEPLTVLSGILGILSGRVRTDTFDNFSSDMMGYPSQEDRRKAFEQQQKAINPNWKPGDPWVIPM